MVNFAPESLEAQGRRSSPPRPQFSHQTPSRAAKDAKTAGLDLITWPLERSGILADGNNGFYEPEFDSAIHREGDLMRVIDALAQDVGVLGVFSDWASPATFYANCMGLK